MLRRGTYLLLLALVGGCAPGLGSGQWVFERENTTAAQLKVDQSECFSASMDLNYHRSGTIRVDRDAYRACMEARGYRILGGTDATAMTVAASR
jgi:hypothetical protein